MSRVNHGDTMYVATITQLSGPNRLRNPPPVRFTCRFAVNGRSIPCDNNFEIFVGGTFYGVRWVNDSNGLVHRDAIHIGNNNFIGRVSAARPRQIGTIERKYQSLTFSLQQQDRWVENLSSSYQVLCWNF